MKTKQKAKPSTHKGIINYTQNEIMGRPSKFHWRWSEKREKIISWKRNNASSINNNNNNPSNISSSKYKCSI